MPEGRATRSFRDNTRVTVHHPVRLILGRPIRGQPPSAIGFTTASHRLGRMSRSVLVLNRGSSSIKFALFTWDPSPRALARGTVGERALEDPLQQVTQRVAAEAAQHPLAAIGHRIVHGGTAFREPQVVTASIISGLKSLAHLAPNHLPDEIALIEAVQRREPRLAQMVCFDTAFHADLPDVARRLPVAADYAARGVQRYGFHGLSYTFLMDELSRRGSSARRVVLAHLGNGSSLAAVCDGRSIDTTMGFTPVGGVVMSTRAGDLDPGVVTEIARLRGFGPDQVDEELSRRAGLWALSNGVTDMRELLTRESADESCRLAVAIYCYEIKKRIGAFAAALGGLDALVFSGGIGEHAPVVRARICAGLEFLGLTLDPDNNAANAALISAPGSPLAVHVIPTDEEIVIARAAYRLLH